MKILRSRAALAATFVLAGALAVPLLASSAAATTSSAPAGGGGGVLVAGQSAEPDRFDPHLTSAYASFQVLENVYDTLVQPGDDLTMEPALATDWTTSEDGLTWTFNLRQGVKFHNGRELTADDVVYSLERIRDPEVGAGPSYRLDAVDKITALDDHTVEITVTAPTPNLLTLLGGYKGMAIVARENVEDGTIDTQPIGTGPFMFELLQPGRGRVVGAQPGLLAARPAPPRRHQLRRHPRPDRAAEQPAERRRRLDRLGPAGRDRLAVELRRRRPRSYLGGRLHLLRPQREASAVRRRARAPGDRHGDQPRGDHRGGDLRSGHAQRDGDPGGQLLALRLLPVRSRPTSTAPRRCSRRPASAT